jgi:NitT/TauT family transport system substrate-binding protein
MNSSYVSSHKDAVQKLVNAYVKTLKWMQTHTAAEIADKMPPDYYAGNKALYVTALQNQMAIFSPDGSMPAGAPQSVLNTEYQSNLIPQGKQIDLNATYTNEFTSKAS